MKKQIFFLAALCLVPLSGAESGKQTLRFVQDDAQDTMVSKIYVLRYAQSNDLMPFVAGMVKRYNMNSVVNCIEYGEDNQQFLTVSCPPAMMKYVDDFVALADRPVRINGKIPGEIIKGTGITRAVYQPKYRSGQVLVNLIVNAIINAGPYGSVYGYDANSNQIYWKDNTSNTDFVYQFLGFVDRPAPQITMDFTLYEVRESLLRDLGIDYLAWKNGPGLDLFQTAFRVFDLDSAGTAAIEAASGPFGGFFFAPQFDASFVRILAQSGNAKIQNSATLTVANSDSRSYSIRFNPQLQNLTKTENDQSNSGLSGVSSATLDQVSLSIAAPIVSIHAGEDELPFSVPLYEPGENAFSPGTLFFGYTLKSANAVERNNYGAELIETTSITGNVTIPLHQEKIIAVWDKMQEVTQTIGVPFLCRIPYLKYLFSTETFTREKTHLYLTVKASVMNTSVHQEAAGKLKRLK